MGLTHSLKWLMTWKFVNRMSKSFFADFFVMSRSDTHSPIIFLLISVVLIIIEMQSSIEFQLKAFSICWKNVIVVGFVVVVKRFRWKLDFHFMASTTVNLSIERVCFGLAFIFSKTHPENVYTHRWDSIF